MNGQGRAYYNDPVALFPVTAAFFNSFRSTATGTHLSVERLNRREHPSVRARRNNFVAALPEIPHDDDELEENYNDDVREEEAHLKPLQSSAMDHLDIGREIKSP